MGGSEWELGRDDLESGSGGVVDSQCLLVTNTPLLVVALVLMLFVHRIVVVVVVAVAARRWPLAVMNRSWTCDGKGPW